MLSSLGSFVVLKKESLGKAFLKGEDFEAKTCRMWEDKP